MTISSRFQKNMKKKIIGGHEIEQLMKKMWSIFHWLTHEKGAKRGW